MPEAAPGAAGDQQQLELVQAQTELERVRLQRVQAEERARAGLEHAQEPALDDNEEEQLVYVKPASQTLTIFGIHGRKT